MKTHTDNAKMQIGIQTDIQVTKRSIQKIKYKHKHKYLQAGILKNIKSL